MCTTHISIAHISRLKSFNPNMFLIIKKTITKSYQQRHKIDCFSDQFS